MLTASGCSGDTEDSATGGAGGAYVTGGASAKSTGGNLGAGGSLGSSGGSSATTGGAGSVDLTSDPGSGSCSPTFTPCGGDVLGTWRVESLCLDTLPSPTPNCPTASTTFSLEGSLTFRDDGTYLPSGVTHSKTTFPPACSELCAAATCSATSDGGCVCEASVPLNEAPLPYAVSGNQLIVSPSGEVTQTAYYCRTVTQLLMRGYSTAGTRYQYDLRR